MTNDRVTISVPAVHIHIRLRIPLTRGLGSSAAAIVAGLVGANVLAGSSLTQAEVMQQVIAMGGFPDNAVPALVGGCRLAVLSGFGCGCLWTGDQ